MRIIAFLILAAFYGCYLIKMLHQKKKGIQTDQLGKGKLGFVKFIEITMKITTYLTPLVEVVSIILGTTLFPSWVRVLGACISFIGVVLFILSVLTMILFHLQIVNVEEDFLVTTFGEEYVDYKKHVYRYIGRKRQRN